MSRPTGGPAFPRPFSKRELSDGSTELNHATDGMSLRDYFAAAALQGLLAGWCCDPHGVDTRTERQLIEQAVRMADALLAAREAQS